LLPAAGPWGAERGEFPEGGFDPRFLGLELDWEKKTNVRLFVSLVAVTRIRIRRM